MQETLEKGVRKKKIIRNYSALEAGLKEIIAVVRP